MNRKVAKQVTSALTNAGRPDLAVAFARHQVKARTRIKADTDKAEFMKIAKGFARIVNKLGLDLEPKWFAPTVMFFSIGGPADKVEAFRKSKQAKDLGAESALYRYDDGTMEVSYDPMEKHSGLLKSAARGIKPDWIKPGMIKGSTIARTQVTAKSNPEVVRELKQMGILPQGESASDYPAIGQDPTWESLYAVFPTVTAKKRAIAKCLRAGKRRLATAVSKMPVRRRRPRTKVIAGPKLKVSAWWPFVDTLIEAWDQWAEVAVGGVKGKEPGEFKYTGFKAVGLSSDLNTASFEYSHWVDDPMADKGISERVWRASIYIFYQIGGKEELEVSGSAGYEHMTGRSLSVKTIRKKIALAQLNAGHIQKAVVAALDDLADQIEEYTKKNNPAS